MDTALLANLAIGLLADRVVAVSRLRIEPEVHWARCADAEAVFGRDYLEAITAFLAHIRALALAILAVHVLAGRINACLRLSI